MGNCKDCKHWYQFDDEDETYVYEGHGRCRAIEIKDDINPVFDSRESEDMLQTIYFLPPGKLSAKATVIADAVGWVLTRPDFGCVMFYGKD